MSSASQENPAHGAGPAVVLRVYCDGCGGELDLGEHARCQARRAASDPPRYCVACGRKLVVQVLPLGWTAWCVRCGPLERRDLAGRP